MRSQSIMSEVAKKVQAVQVFGRKKNAVAVAYTKAGKGLLKVNGSPIQLLEPETLRIKALEPVLLLGKERFANLDIRVRVQGGGYVSQAFGACTWPWWQVGLCKADSGTAARAGRCPCVLGRPVGLLPVISAFYKRRYVFVI